MKYFTFLLTIIMITLFGGCGKDNNLLEIHIIDVGQGDSTLIKTPLGKNILIDAGDEKSDYIVKNYLKNQKIKDIDIIIASHFDSDHIGGLDNIINDFNVKKVYAPNDISDTSSFNNFITACNNKNIQIEYLKKDYILNIEKNIVINVLSPSSISDNTNGNSIVFDLTYLDKSFLFTGDTEKNNENEMIKNYDLEHIDFLKVSHHGSYTSSSEEFLKEITPDISVISCGYKNSYGHPHKSTLDTLNKHNSLIFRTDKNGDLIFYSDGKIIFTNEKISD